MCGRYELSEAPEKLEKRFRARLSVAYEPRWNIAPAGENLVLRDPEDREFELLRWGMRPKWWKEKGRSLINVRAESLGDKPIFRRHLEGRRLIVPATSFYEWRREGNFKRPFRIRRADGEPLALAGVWEIDRDEQGREYESFAILTCPPGRAVQEVHSRMPCILLPEDEDRWLEPDANPARLLKLLRPYPDDRLEIQEVSKTVDSPTNDDPGVARPVGTG